MNVEDEVEKAGEEEEEKPKDLPDMPFIEQ